MSHFTGVPLKSNRDRIYIPKIWEIQIVLSKSYWKKQKYLERWQIKRYFDISCFISMENLAEISITQNHYKKWGRKSKNEVTLPSNLYKCSILCDLIFIKIQIVLSKFDSNFSVSLRLNSRIKVEFNHSACTKTAMISENIFRFQTRRSQPTKELYLHCAWLPWVSG